MQNVPVGQPLIIVQCNQTFSAVRSYLSYATKRSRHVLNTFFFSAHRPGGAGEMSRNAYARTHTYSVQKLYELWCAVSLGPNRH